MSVLVSDVERRVCDRRQETLTRPEYILCKVADFLIERDMSCVEFLKAIPRWAKRQDNKRRKVITFF